MGRENSPSETEMLGYVEKLRIGMCFIGIFLGHMTFYRTFAILVVSALAGVTGCESLLLSDASARAKGWPVGTPYQLQSGCGNVALALGGIAFFLRGPSERADAALAAVASVTIGFIGLSGVNHAFNISKAAIHKKRAIGAASLAFSAGWVIYKWSAF